jgi:hypothetical protein
MVPPTSPSESDLERERQRKAENDRVIAQIDEMRAKEHEERMAQQKAAEAERQAAQRTSIPSWPTPPSYDTPQAQDLTLGAEQAAEDAVRAKLKAPSTARFGPAIASVMDGPFYAGCVKVMGTVDAQNSFGVLLRTDYQVILSGRFPQWVPVVVEVGE